MGTEEELLIAADNGRNLLDQDTVPNRNQSLDCFSCGTRMAGLYCHHCGNKNDNYRRSVLSLAFEMFQNLTAMDSRMWQSLWSLVRRPGRMARQFADGARQRWTSPVRMYIAASLLLFGYIAFSQTQIIAVGSIGESQPSSLVKVGTETGSLSPRLLFFIRKSEMNDTSELGSGSEFGDNVIDGLSNAANMSGNLDNAIAELDQQIANADNDIEREILQTTRDGLVNQRIEQNAVQDADRMLDASGVDSDQNADTSDIDGSSESSDSESGGLNFTRPSGETVTLDREGLQQVINMVMQRPELVNNQVNDNLKLAMFIMMPFAMLMGAFFIRGRERAMLYDHLVHAAYIHAFSFMLLLVFILLHQHTSMSGLIVPYTLILLVYLPLSARGMFGRGWFKSFLTAYGVGAIYSLIMLLVFAGIVALALESLAYDVSTQRALTTSS